MPLANQSNRSYILRLWREASATRPVWRVSLTVIPDGPRFGFAGLVEAVRYLQSELAALDEQMGDNGSNSGDANSGDANSGDVGRGKESRD